MKKLVRVTIACALVSLAIGQAANASVPHTFSANTPARASEVNANFSGLDSRIQDLETGSSACANETASITYSKAITNVGDTFMYGQEKYIIIAIPLYDPSTGKGYKVKFAALAAANGADATSYIYSNGGYSFGYCSNLIIDGYSASSNVGYSSQAIGRTNGKSTWNTAYTVSITIKVGNMIFSVVGGSDTKTQEAIHGDMEYDFTAKMDYSLMAASKANAITKADLLLDYIEIMEMP